MLSGIICGGKLGAGTREGGEKSTEGGKKEGGKWISRGDRKGKNKEVKSYYLLFYIMKCILRWESPRMRWKSKIKGTGSGKSRPLCFLYKERSAFCDSLNYHPLSSVAQESNSTCFIT